LQKSPLSSANMVVKKEKEKKKEKRKEKKPSVRSHHKEGSLMDHPPMTSVNLYHHE
jgi:hypothetical protein